MAVIAAGIRRLRLAILVTPLARRRPWKVAREAVPLDHLSHGRVILGLAWATSSVGSAPDPILW
jgi:alkanesulfonate monooxygenase SsuD/methylene tetrahydromethanopterin reductase-like flavin-dependent oxidoreductase (luciferase family)